MINRFIDSQVEFLIENKEGNTIKLEFQIIGLFSMQSKGSLIYQNKRFNEQSKQIQQTKLTNHISDDDCIKTVLTIVSFSLIGGMASE